MAKDISQLADEIDSLPDEGMTVAESRRQDNTTSLMEKVLEALARPQVAPVVQVAAPVMPSIAFPEISIPPAQVTVQPSKQVLDWTFTFERNPDGTIKSIRAKAT